VSVRTTAVGALGALVVLGSVAISTRAAAPDAGAAVEAAAAAAPERIDGPASAGVQARRLTLPTPGNPGGVPLPVEARPVETSRPDRVIGSGTPASCTPQAVVDAVALGGIITFDCGPDPVTIVMRQTAKMASTTPMLCTVLMRSPKKVKAMTVTATSWITAERLNAAAMPNSRTRRSMMRLPPV